MTKEKLITLMGETLFESSLKTLSEYARTAYDYLQTVDGVSVTYDRYDDESIYEFIIDSCHHYTLHFAEFDAFLNKLGRALEKEEINNLQKPDDLQF